jgi:hypothetical protein
LLDAIGRTVSAQMVGGGQLKGRNRVWGCGRMQGDDLGTVPDFGQARDGAQAVRGLYVA